MPLPTPNAQGKVLGILKPLGGGDPIPLLKPEVIVGRRRSADIFLDFNNISGRHCQLRLINSVWHVRDLGSTNGTSLNGMGLASEHSVLPDDELGIASHLFTIDYEPGGPEAVVHAIDEMADESRGADTRFWSWPGSTTTTTSRGGIVPRRPPDPAVPRRAARGSRRPGAQ